MKDIRMLVKSVAFLCLLTLGLVGCNNSNSNESEEQTKTETEHKDEIVTSQKNYCFRNEYPHEGSEDKDVLELQIEVKGNTVTGAYNWLPAFKDQRKGAIRGMLEDSIIKGEYNFQQEGTTETVRIEIALEDDKAVVKGGEPALGLEATIQKVECAN
ncbi:MAG: hypothetical protein R3E32_04325 [Chitinophagales bacterium]